MPAQQPKTLDRILVSLKLKKDEPALTREQAMQAWPVRNPALKVHVADDDLVTIELPRRKDWMGGVLGFMFSVPEAKPVQLDEVGSLVWSLCDGENTVNDIVAALVDEYKLNRREVEVSLTQYLQTLAKRGMIGFAVPREVAEAAGLSGEEIGPTAPAEETAVASAASAADDFHPETPETAEPVLEDTTDLPPVSADAPDDAAPAERTDDQEHPGGP
ncbi:MAG: PqqD family protein [Armatimonadetes bacterium]|nr:PqqD family protein [Armatimonadota bacterium]